MLKIIHTADFSDDLAQKRRDELAATIRDYANLPDDWDGFDGCAPARQDIENAVSFIKHIPVDGLFNIFNVRATVAGDGDVVFAWRQGEPLEIGFIEGEISFYGSAPNGEPIDGDEQYKEGDIPLPLRQLLSLS